MIVLGASAGGVEALKTVVAGLPANFPAAVLIVLHMAPSSPSILPRLLQGRCALPVDFAADGEPLVAGRVYVASPDRHLVVERGRVRVTRAPRENHSRPAIDPLFRSAALAYGARAVGVILSGRLDDGTAGLWAVKDRGGVAIVQDPADALHADMPRNALQYTTADHVLRADAIAPLLVRLVTGPAEAAPPLPDRPPPRELELEVRIAMEDSALRQGVMTLGPVSPYTCPECHGVLVRVQEGGVPRFRCHTGHAYSIDSLLASLTETVEATLWNALRAVEESVMLLHEAAARARGADTGLGARDDARLVGARLEEKAREAETRAEAIRQAVLRHQALSLASVRAAAGATGAARDAAARDDDDPDAAHG
ncbi:MAG: chemotaxis protein CheB [Gemmatirosa sp.]|nr:chemotaxis protein CheB [Gemmatirosa sp.]